MENSSNTVASEISEELLVDDAPATEAEVSIEELTSNLTSEADGQTVVNGDDGQTEAQPEQTERKQDDKHTRQMRAALRSQREQFYKSLGMPEDEVRELIRAHKAEQMAKDDPDISPKAARRIIEAEERAENSGAADQKAIAEGIQSLYDDGWTREELLEFSTDQQARQDLADGKTVRQAARSFLRRGTQPQTRKSAVPTARNTAAGNVPPTDRIAEMSDEEFRKFSQQAEEAALSGKRIRFD